MRCTSLTASACLPVTALVIFQHEEGDLLFAGHGPFLQVYHLNTSKLIGSTRVFTFQAIHHIAITPKWSRTDPDGELEIAVAGGCHASLLRFSPSSGWNTHNRCIPDAQGWILSLRYHDQEDRGGFFALLTTEDRLLLLNSRNPETSIASIKQISQGPTTFLYSGDICSVNPEKLIIAGGSAFGEIVIWVSYQLDIGSSWNSVPMHRFEAHNGSIFGLCISQLIQVGGISTRLVASCSDDRQIRVHDISDTDESAITGFSSAVQETGFGNRLDADTLLTAMAWGHQSRIWGISFGRAFEKSSCTYVQLLSRGEDATCQSWGLTLNQDNHTMFVHGKLMLDLVDHHHNGKHVWSYDHHVISTGTTLVSGGADGRCMKRRLLNLCGSEARLKSVRFQDILSTAKSKTLREYSVVDSSHILALTSSGELLLYRDYDLQPPSWHLIKCRPDSKITRLCSKCPSGIAVVITEAGLGVWSPHVGNVLVETDYSFERPASSLQIAGMSPAQIRIENATLMILTIASDNSALLMESSITKITFAIQRFWNINLPRGFVVTASYYHFSRNLLILGSRSGSMILLDIRNSGINGVQRQFAIAGVHGTDAVTSVQSIMLNSHCEQEHQFYLLTTGRDGRFGIHKVQLDGEYELSIQTVHTSIPTFGPHLEGGIIDPTTEELILLGFKSTQFMVWNETKQITTNSVECGGAHRSWAYQAHGNGLGSFVWTKAGAFHRMKTGTDQASIIQNGGHGREIKALAVSSRSLPTRRFGRCELVATGAEDTEIRLFAVQEARENLTTPMICLTVLRDHTTGLQHLCFTPTGSHLISSGGCEQLYVWRLTYEVPCIQVGVILQDKMPRAEGDVDVRIMSFELLERTDALAFANETDISIAATYSNGKVKVLHYKQGSKPGTGEFHFLREIQFGTFCLTGVLMSSAGMNRDSLMLTAGTNGYLHFSRSAPIKTASTDPENLLVQKVHQNSIQALEMLEIYPNLRLVITGGDDNALAITIHMPSSSVESECRTLRIPKAHAAALTALTVLTSGFSTDGFYAMVLTAGNDQRLKNWRIELSGFAQGEHHMSIDELLNAMVVRKEGEAWTAVADVSNIAKLQQDTSGGGLVSFEVIVVGVGMEVVSIEYES